jgi:hypothetical protein
MGSALHLRLVLTPLRAALQSRLEALQLLLEDLLSRRHRPLAVLAPAQPSAIAQMIMNMQVQVRVKVSGQGRSCL